MRIDQLADVGSMFNGDVATTTEASIHIDHRYRA
jgi:hypothetical protein